MQTIDTQDIGSQRSRLGSNGLHSPRLCSVFVVAGFWFVARRSPKTAPAPHGFDGGDGRDDIASKFVSRLKLPPLQPNCKSIWHRTISRKRRFALRVSRTA